MVKFTDRKKKWGEQMVFRALNLPANIVSKLQLLKTLYEDGFGRKVSYGEIFERLLSPMGLGSVDPGIYREFKKVLEVRAEFDEVVTRHTKELADTIEARAQANGTTFAEEAAKEQERAIAKANKMSALHAQCQDILETATLPTPDAGWVEDNWFVNPETGQFFPVYVSEIGKAKYARYVDGKIIVSASEMKAKGFVQHYFQKK